MKKTDKKDSLIVAHARRELEMAHLFEKNGEYDGSIGRGTLSLIKSFSEWCGDDTSKMSAIHSCFNYLVAGEILSPPTTDPNEWEDYYGPDNQKLKRNKRNPFYITQDNGESWSNIRTKESGYSINHITGEAKEGSPDDGKINSTTEGLGTTSDGGDGTNAVIPDEAKISQGPSQVEERELDAGVEAQSSEAPQVSEGSAPEPKKGA